MDFDQAKNKDTIVDTVRQFVETEIYPHEEMVEAKAVRCRGN